MTLPVSLSVSSGINAIAHAVESFVSTKRNTQSQAESIAAWQLLECNYERVLAEPDDLEARAAMPAVVRRPVNCTGSPGLIARGSISPAFTVALPGKRATQAIYRFRRS